MVWEGFDDSKDFDGFGQAPFVYASLLFREWFVLVSLLGGKGLQIPSLTICFIYPSGLNSLLI